jgi:hypothetical protein
MATSCSTAAAQVAVISSSSPAYAPQQTFALVTTLSSATSSPEAHRSADSPRSAFTSMRMTRG